MHFIVDLNQLTGRGVEQMFDIGQELRQRYLLPGTTQIRGIDSTFHPDQYFFRSSDIDRALTSASALATGLFPPGTGHVNPVTGNFR